MQIQYIYMKHYIHNMLYGAFIVCRIFGAGKYILNSLILKILCLSITLLLQGGIVTHGDLISAYQYLKGRGQEDEARLLLSDVVQ